MLVQRAAAGDVEHLGAAADRQHRERRAPRRAGERELEAVELGLRGAELGVLVGPVGGRVQVGAAREAETVETVEQGVDAAGSSGARITGSPPPLRTASG